MISTTIFPGRYIQGFGAVSRLGTEIARLGASGFLIGGSTVYNQLLPQFRQDIEQKVKIETAKFNGECCDDEIARLLGQVNSSGGDVVIGMGGGKVIDTAKAVAHLAGLPLIIVPTIAASDAPCSAVSVIYTPSGLYSHAMTHPRNPEAVLVDTRIIVEAPVRYLVAGMGDALSTWFEAESCRLKNSGNMTFTGDPGSLTAYALARLCYENLLEYGLSAKLACQAGAVTPAVEHIVETNTLLSGVGFESCGIAGAHGFQIGFTSLKETHSHLHGEVVAFGTLASLFLTDKKQSQIEEVYRFCESVGLPTTLAGIGLTAVTADQLERVAETVMDKDNPIHNELAPVSRQSILAAIKTADYMGKARSSQLITPSS